MGYLGDHLDPTHLPPRTQAGPVATAVPPDERAPPSGPGLPGGFLAAYIDAARQIEIDPYLQLRRQRLPTQGLEDENLVVPLGDLVDVIERTARLAGCPAFALCLASAANPAALGPLALLAYSQPTVRDAITLLCARICEGEGRLRPILLEHADAASLQLTGDPAAVDRADCAADLAPALAVRAMQGLLGDAWRPLRTELARARPADSGPYEEFFGDVLFDQDGDAISFRRADLDRRSPLASPPLARLIEQHLRLREAFVQQSFADQVTALIEALLPRGLCSIERVAEQLRVHRRTVHRRLAEQGLSFGAMELAVRRRIAEAEVADRRRPISAIARSVGFASPAAFSRWFSSAYGHSPTAGRRTQLEPMAAYAPASRPASAPDVGAATRSE